MRNQRACKVLVLNFRGGHEAQPFWNMLSINPVHHQGQLMLYMVRRGLPSPGLRHLIRASAAESLACDARATRVGRA